MTTVTRRNVSRGPADTAENRERFVDDPANRGMWLGGHYRLPDGITRDYYCRWCSPRKRVRLERHYEPDDQRFVMVCSQGLHQVTCWADVRHYAEIDYLTEQAQIEERIARELYPRWSDKMPIARIDRQTDEAPGLYEIGRIRKGAAKPEDGRRPGKDLDHFRLTLNDGEDLAVLDILRETLGDEPNEIRVFLPFDTIEAVWDYWIEVYVAGGLLHQCDGEHIRYARNPKTREVTVKDWIDQKSGGRIECDRSGHYAKKGDKRVDVSRPTGRLRVILPQLGRAVSFTFVTSSWNDIQEITANLKTFKRMFGTLAGLPVILKRRPRMISTPTGEGGKPVRRLKHLVHLELDPDFIARQYLLLAEKQEKADLLLEAGNGGEKAKAAQREAAGTVLFGDEDFEGFDPEPGKKPTMPSEEIEEGEIIEPPPGQGDGRPADEEYEDFKAEQHGLTEEPPKRRQPVDGIPVPTVGALGEMLGDMPKSTTTFWHILLSWRWADGEPVWKSAIECRNSVTKHEDKYPGDLGERWNAIIRQTIRRVEERNKADVEEISAELPESVEAADELAY